MKYPNCNLLTVNVGEDCPVFDGLFEFCQLSTGGSVGKCMAYMYKYDHSLHQIPQNVIGSIDVAYINVDVLTCLLLCSRGSEAE